MFLLLSCIHHPRISHHKKKIGVGYMFLYIFIIVRPRFFPKFSQISLDDFSVSLSRSAEEPNSDVFVGDSRNPVAERKIDFLGGSCIQIQHLSCVENNNASIKHPPRKTKKQSRRDDFFIWLLTRAEIVQYAVYPIASCIQHVQTFCLRGLLPFCSVQPTPFVFVRAQVLLHLIAS